MSKITLELTERQLSFLEAALDTAMENEGDSRAYREFSKLMDLVLIKQQVVDGSKK